MSRKVLSEKPITLERVRDLLKQRESNAELNYIQRVTLEYAHKFSRHFPQSEEMLELLGEQFNISREEGIQLINTDPEQVEEITLILENQYDENTKQEILALFSQYKEQYKKTESKEES
ncbi:MAG: hypothetical protein ACXAC7_12200 [Candidatus Hodarchaeales archaeon]|jgi:DNA-directed RNA polymerase subunit F